MYQFWNETPYLSRSLIQRPGIAVHRMSDVGIGCRLYDKKVCAFVTFQPEARQKCGNGAQFHQVKAATCSKIPIKRYQIGFHYVKIDPAGSVSIKYIFAQIQM